MKRPDGQSCLFLLSDNLHFAEVVVRIGAQHFFACVLSTKKGRIFKPRRSLCRLTGFGENHVFGRLRRYANVLAGCLRTAHKSDIIA